MTIPIHFEKGMHMSKLQELSARIPRVRLLRDHSSVSTLTRHSDTPCLPAERDPGVSEHKNWDRKIAALMRSAQDFGRRTRLGETFTYAIPEWMIPRKFPGYFASCVIEAGYEFDLAPQECSIHIENGARSGYVVFKKVPAQS